MVKDINPTLSNVMKGCKTMKNKVGRPTVKDKKKRISVRVYPSDLEFLKSQGISLQKLLDQSIQELKQ